MTLYTSSCDYLDSTFKDGILTLRSLPCDYFTEYINKLDREYNIFKRTESLIIVSDSMIDECSFLSKFTNLEHVTLDGSRFFRATIPIPLESVTITNGNTNPDIFNTSTLDVEHIIIKDSGFHFPIFNSDSLKKITYMVADSEIDNAIGYFDYMERDEKPRKTMIVEKYHKPLSNIIHRVVQAQVTEHLIMDQLPHTVVVFILGPNLFIPKMWYVTKDRSLIFQSTQEPQNIKLVKVEGDNYYFIADNNFKFMLSWDNSLNHFIDQHNVHCDCNDKTSCMELRRVDIFLDKEETLEYLRSC